VQLDSRGFSLTELIVVMGIFITVMLITSSTFKTIANSSSQQSKSLETQIEGIVGLEVLRADLEQTGFGLPWTFQNTILTTNYVESVLGSNMPTTGYWPAGDPSSFNDAPGGEPRPIQSGNTNFNKGSAADGAKYIVIKSAAAATNDASKKWTNVSYDGGVKSIASWGDAARDFAATDRIMVIKNNLKTTPVSRQLMVTGTGSFAAPFSSYSTLIRSPQDGDTYQIYGISPGSITPKMPFNRADYFLQIPSSMPEGCAPNTGILYKKNISHSTGGYDPTIPLLDCVADLQIVYGLDTDGGGRVNLHTTTAPATAAEQRAQVRELRVYILAQDGKKDFSFRYPSQTVDVGERFDGVTLTGKSFDLLAHIGTGWQNYRWKVYTIVVRPKNLIQ
jgi:type II secretory pathway pseudopilin PulG